MGNLEGAKEGQNLVFFAGDLLKSGSYDEAFAGADAVMHMAAVVEIFDVKDPQKEIVDPSVEGTRNVLASAGRAGTVKRFVHTSSVAAVWAMDKPQSYAFSESDYNDWSSISNGDPYGYAKVTAERMVRDHILQGKKGYDLVTLNPA